MEETSEMEDEAGSEFSTSSATNETPETDAVEDNKPQQSLDTVETISEINAVEEQDLTSIAEVETETNIETDSELKTDNEPSTTDIISDILVVIEDETSHSPTTTDNPPEFERIVMPVSEIPTENDQIEIVDQRTHISCKDDNEYSQKAHAFEKIIFFFSVETTSDSIDFVAPFKTEREGQKTSIHQ